MNAPEPRANPLLLGHAAAEATLAEALRSGRLHHAWLFFGPAGIGKATLAFRFARRVLAGPAAEGTLALAETDPVFRRVASGGHADLLTIEREWDEKKKGLRGEIVIDAVRGVAEFLSLTPAEGGWRVVVIDDAESLNRNAANALLKVLEEPPARTLLLLVCSGLGRLPATVLSRCLRLRLAPLGDADMAALLARYLPEKSEAERARLVSLAEGSPGRALQLAEGGIAAAELVDQVLAALPDLTASRAHEVADRLGRDEEAFSTFMDLLRAALAAAVREAARGRGNAEQARVAALRPLAAWVDVWQALTHLQNETESFHLDRRQALLTGFSLLAGHR